MKGKIVWSVLSCLMVLALVLTSCRAAPEVGEGQTIKGEVEEKPGLVEEEEKGKPAEEKPVEKPGVEEGPQYGGTIRYRSVPYLVRGFSPLVWDNNTMLAIIFDRYFTAPWEKGPAGSNENPLDRQWYPQSFYRGEMLESWQVVDMHRVEFKLREGIHYWNKEPVNGRELTAEDVIYNFLRDAFHPRCQTYLRSREPAAALDWWERLLNEIEEGAFPEEVLRAYLAELREATPELEQNWPFKESHPEGLVEYLKAKYADCYNLLAEKGYDVEDIPLLTLYYSRTGKYSFEGRSLRGLRTLWNAPNGIWPCPREVIEKYGGFDQWDQVVGTGPWIPEQFFPESEVRFRRNPDYWQYDPLHPENRLPYADRLQVVIIEDESLFYTALQTGKLDVGTVEWYKVDFFKKNCPDMLYHESPPSQTWCVFVRNDIPPFNDKRVRHACMLAIDNDEIVEKHYKGLARKYTWPLQEYMVPAFTPLEELPDDIQELFGYNPEKAKQLLTEAGYPNGFKTTLYVYPSAEDRDRGQMIKEYLSKIGIDVQLEVPESTAFISILYGRQYEHMISCLWGNNFPVDALDWAEGGNPQSPYNFGNVVDDLNEEVSERLDQISDDDEYYRLLKENTIHQLEMMYEILTATPISVSFWWPWLKGYHGESDLGWPDETRWGEIPKYLWIDQELKKSMGY